MSRSIKNTGIIKDNGLSRGEYNRRFRRVNKQRIKLGKDPKQMNEIVNPYDVCDFIIFWDKLNLFQYLGKEVKESESGLKKRKRLYFGK